MGKGPHIQSRRRGSTRARNDEDPSLEPPIRRKPPPSEALPLLLLGFLVLLVEDLHEGFGHVIWLLQGAVVPLQVFH